jgi:hypothetical protein
LEISFRLIKTGPEDSIFSFTKNNNFFGKIKIEKKKGIISVKAARGTLVSR